jgi:hypothetical protein
VKNFNITVKPSRVGPCLPAISSRSSSSNVQCSTSSPRSSDRATAGNHRAAAGACGGQTVVGVGDDELALVLGEHGEHAEHGAAFGGGGIDALLDDVQADLTLA